MKILVLTTTFKRWEHDTDPPFIYTLCEKLSAGHQCHVLAPHCKGAKVREIYHDAIHVFRYRYFFTRGETLAYEGGILNKLSRKPWRLLLLPSFFCAQLLATLRALREQDIDLIHAHWIIPHALTALLARILCRKKIPILCTAHGSDLYKLNHPLFKYMQKNLLQKIDHLTVVSHGMRDYCQQHLQVPADKISVIPMGTDFTRFTPNPDINREPRRIVYAGRFIESKGVHILIKAFAIIIASFPNAELWLIGDGPYKTPLHHLCDSLHLQQQVHFFGAKQQSELPNLLSAAGIAVVPSLQAEGFGLSIVEAMGCECALIASDSAAAREIIEPYRTGLLVPPNNPYALAHSLLELLHNPEKTQNLGHHARLGVIQRYSWDASQNAFLDIINRLTTKQGNIA